MLVISDYASKTSNLSLKTYIATLQLSGEMPNILEN